MERIIGTTDDVVKNHLFIICPNNSGSNVLRTALSASSATWNLEREGQHSIGFHGPTTRGSGARLIWGSNEKWLSLFRDASAYDWPKTKLAWHKQAFAKSPEARVFVTSSPPFLLNVPALKAHFPGSKFLFMVRNPYAVAEGICRRAAQQIVQANEDIRNLAARHIMTCLEIQKHNIERYGEDGLFFTYEKMCAAPEEISSRIQAMLPAITDLEFTQNLAVKGIYDEPLRDMNTEQIGRLSEQDISVMNSIFTNHRPLLGFFGYSIIPASN